MNYTIKPHCGYWDVTQYPKGGCFRGAKQEIPLQFHKETDHWADGSLKEFIGITPDGKHVCVEVLNCSVETTCPPAPMPKLYYTPSGFPYLKDK